MATRSTKSTPAQTATAQAAEQVTQPHVEAIQADEEISLLDMMRNVGASIGVEIPTGRQMIAGSITMVIVSVMGTYSAIQIASYVAIGAALLTGSAFIAFLLSLLVVVAGIYAALIAASRASAYVASGKLEEHAARAKNYITGFFRPAAPKTVAEAAAV